MNATRKTRRTGNYQDMVGVLEAELGGVEDVFAGLSAAEWAVATGLVPFDPGQPRWTLFELAGHFDISIGLTRMLIADPQAGLPERDGVSFFLFSRPEIAPELYDYAYTMVEGKTPAQVPGVLHETFAKTVQEARAAPPGIVSPFPGFEPYPLMRLDEFVLTRIVEAVVHGMDISDALGARPSPRRTASQRPSASWTSCSPGGPTPAARPVLVMTSPGCARRPDATSTPIRGFR